MTSPSMQVMLKVWMLLCAFGLSLSLQAQSSQEVFGQNRVQYKIFEWQYYESEHFVTYFYQGGQALGRFASQMAETDLIEIEEMLDYRVNREINIIVYNTISDFNQSNIGSAAGINYNTGGRTTIIGNKLFVYFDGDHDEMRRQIREGIARILVDNMVFGGNLQEIVQNAVLLNLPEWFVEGLVAYIGEDWNADLDDVLRDGMLSGRYTKFNKLTGEDARFAGHSLWYFIAEKYGEANIPNLLYLIRVNRSLENGFLFVLGKTVNQTVDEWQEYYLQKYEQEQQTRTAPDDAVRIDKKYRKKFDYHSIALSPDGKRLAYVTDDEGRFRVRVLDLTPDASKMQARKGKKVKKGGMKTRSLAADHSYPLLAWDDKSNKLAVIWEKRAISRLLIYDFNENEKEEREIPRFQRIQHINFTDDGRRLVMSAINRGQSDLYLFYIKNGRLEQLTNDYHDDLDAAWVDLDGKEGIVFASNRDSDTLINAQLDSVLPVGNLDLYFLNYEERKSKKLLRLTDTESANERLPLQYNDLHFSYVSDGSGIRNRYAGYLDSVYDHTEVTVFFKDSVAFNPDYDYNAYSESIDSVWQIPVYRDTAVVFPVTNFSRNVIEQSIAMRPGKSADLFYVNGRPEFYLHPLPRDLAQFGGQELENTAFRDYREAQEAEAIAEEEAEEEKPTADYFFQSEFPEVELKETVRDITQVTPEISSGNAQSNLLAKTDFQRTKIRPYKLKYGTEGVTSQLDNSLFLNRYQPFGPNAGSFNQPNLSGLFTVSIADLFEDYRFIGGFRLPTSLGGAEYFLSFSDYSRRLDWRVLHYFSSERLIYPEQSAARQRLPFDGDFEVIGKLRSNISSASLTWPFDVMRSVRAHFTYRNDKTEYLAINRESLDLPRSKEDWVSLKVEYVFDNSFELGTNIREGMRWKVWGEVHKGFAVNVGQGVGFDLSFDDGFLGVVGGDFRHYTRIHRNLIWANRVATGMSFGASKLLYYLGGVDSWIGAEFDQDAAEVDFDAGYAFQTLGTNLRGFPQNIRNGSSYAVLNSEIRWPIFSYLVNKPIRSEIIRNFQVVGFFDAGSAWRGAIPWDDENRFNVVTVPESETGPVVTTVNFFQNPLVAGYGFGARTLIFGYFLRFDMAWGLDTGEITDPRYYFSLSLDF